MAERTKYPLTPIAKEAAIGLAQAWDNGTLEQLSIFTEVVGDGRVMNTRIIGIQTGLMSKFSITRNVLYELSRYGLVELNHRGSSSWEVLLLQELQNAVASNFDVSDYFLTVNAIGVINLGTIHGVTMGAASIYGNVAQTIEQLANEVEQLLGTEVLSKYENLKTSIEELKISDEPNRMQKMARVMEELSRYVGHVGNAGSAITAIILVARAMGAI